MGVGARRRVQAAARDPRALLSSILDDAPDLDHSRGTPCQANDSSQPPPNDDEHPANPTHPGDSTHAIFTPARATTLASHGHDGGSRLTVPSVALHLWTVRAYLRT
jgi:hypothetical protein